MRIGITGLAVAAMATLGACGPSQTCYGLADGPAIDKVIHGFASRGGSDKGDPAHMAFSRARVVGVGRKDAPKASGQSAIQIWFREDDGTLTVASLDPDCNVQFRPNLAPDSINNAAYPTHPPKF